MANFQIAYDATMGHEGRYSNDPDDVGGETYRGISRRFHPGWSGWVIIDHAKAEQGFPKNLSGNARLDGQVRTFYQMTFWDRFQGDKIPDQAVANELFDTAVNMDVPRAVMFFQKALNLLNRNGKMYADIVEDGVFGPATLRAFEGYLMQEPGSDVGPLLTMMNAFQAVHYAEFMRKSPVQEKHARGWLKRVQLTRT